jgi:hypothetical protein
MDNSAECLDATERWRLANFVQMLNDAGPSPSRGAELVTEARNARQSQQGQSFERAEHEAQLTEVYKIV